MHFLNTVCKMYHLKKKKIVFYTTFFNRERCGYKIAFYHIAIKSQMQLIVQPYLNSSLK